MIHASREARVNEAAAKADLWFKPGRFAVLLAVCIFAAYPEVVLGARAFFFRDFGYFAYPLAFHHRESFTDKYDVERLLYWDSFGDVHKAIAREKQLKGWRRSKKVGLIESLNPHWLDLAKDWYPWMKECGIGRDASTTPGRSQAAGQPPLSMTGRRSSNKAKFSEGVNE